ncbi:MAG: aryl-sulfate sulfotransferase [Lactobacillus sp.]|jgi:hypothetical protein|nr:aryl-sulfate sulfotransferase [Lactobacillus sp.]MCI1481266.1 aryl-sulfate sulfotransferase [Lactobacillus sp.]MCI1943158.1 aryl-sulfate sulfotransferase [Lactobacillus sp.]MCI1973497.1 aryl-sulfate sulfotransferase [Lactobacillus sp.]
MKKTNNKAAIPVILVLAACFASVLFCIHQGIETTANGNAKKTTLTNQQIIKNLGVKSVSKTANDKLTKKYRQILKQKQYSFSKPYIKVNPYQTSPLTALMIFHTKEAAKVSYKVKGKTTGTTISNTVKGYQTNHQVPIVGLYANTTNDVEVTLTYKSGKKVTKHFKLKTGKLPKWITSSKVKVTKNDKSKMQLGNNELTVLNRTTKQTFAVDADGQVRWYYSRWNEHMFKQLNNGHIVLLNKIKNSDYRYNLLVETDYLGRVYRQFSFDKTLGGSYAGTAGLSVVHHDLIELPNGNWLMTVSDGSKYVEDSVAELNTKTGKIVKVIDFKKIFPASMYKQSKIKAADSATKGLGLLDWLHINSLSYDEKTNSLLVSSRNQDMIWSINYKTNKLNWIYSSKAKASWPKSMRKYILTRQAGTQYTGGQHALTLLSSTGSTQRVLLYDNNIAVTNGNKKTSGKYSQAVEYEIDTVKHTIKQVWSYGKSLGKQNFTLIIGNAQRLSNGNTLIDFGYRQNGKSSNIIEVTSQGEQVFNLVLPANDNNKTYAYRAYRLQFFPSNYVFDLNR